MSAVLRGDISDFPAFAEKYLYIYIDFFVHYFFFRVQLDTRLKQCCEGILSAYTDNTYIFLNTYVHVKSNI